MRLLKSETETRYSEGRSGGREDIVMYPEQLCNHDIMLWRLELNHDRSRGEAHPYSLIGMPRANDIAGPTRDPHNRVKDFKAVSEQILRNHT
jgi:hypothetical protein